MWTLHRLRHSAATIIASEFDLDTARAVLGHKSLQVTKIYAKEDMKKIIDKYKKIGRQSLKRCCQQAFAA